jgi:hypothetical protein
MRYWKEIAYCVAGILAVWRISKMSMVGFMRTYRWKGGVWWFRVALMFRSVNGGFLYRIRNFRVAHILETVNASIHVKARLPTDLIQEIDRSSVWHCITDTKRDDLSIDELYDFYALGDKEEFMAGLDSHERWLVNEVGKAFDNLPETIEVKQPIHLFRRG